jgi:hypothetical protein
MKPLVVKNKRLKMSPGGLITLPVSARKCLGMSKGESARVGVDVRGSQILVYPSKAKTAQTFRVSAGGLLTMGGEAKKLLEGAAQRHYWMQMDDRKRVIQIHPFKA